jgi:pilus assembly protein CpaC
MSAVVFLGAWLASPVLAAPTSPVPTPSTSAAPIPPSVAIAAAQGPVLDVGLGESVIQQEARPVSRVLISDPAVAELRLLEEGQYQVRGLAVGSTDLWVWYRDDVAHPRKYAVVVSADLADIERRVQATVQSGPSPSIYAVRDRIVVEGEVPDVETLERVVRLARIYDPEFVNLLTVRGDHQVQLKVVFAEVNRTGLRELGLNVFLQPPGMLGSMVGPGEVQSASSARFLTQNAAPNINGGIVGAPMAGAFNLVGMLTGAFDAAALLSVLEQQNVARTLAEPTVSALSGQQAKMVVGGEVPIPVAQQNEQISVEWKEYGVKVVFVPTVLGGEAIDVRTYVEVSDLDPNNALVSAGLEIPAISKRQGESHLRLRSGDTFALAGMLSERTTAMRAAVPILGDIPLVGALFRYVKHDRAETELVIFVTPELIRPLGPGEVPPPPGATENYNPNDFALFLLGAITEPGSRADKRAAQPSGAYGMSR